MTHLLSVNRSVLLAAPGGHPSDDAGGRSESPTGAGIPEIVARSRALHDAHLGETAPDRQSSELRAIVDRSRELAARYALGQSEP